MGRAEKDGLHGSHVPRASRLAIAIGDGDHIEVLATHLRSVVAEGIIVPSMSQRYAL